MRIGIFGDSHADCNYMSWADEIGIDLGWPELLSKFYKVKNYAQGGSGLWYSYELFKKHHAKFDVNIFLPSQPHRFSIVLPERNSQFNVVPGFHDTTLVDQCLDNTPLDNEIIHAAVSYVKHILNYDKERTLGSGLIDTIVKMRADTIIVNCFDNWNDKIFNPNTNFGLCHLSKLEYEFWNTDPATLRQGGVSVDYRKCHLTEENNVQVFKKVLHAIQNKLTYVDFSKEDFVPPSKPIEFYFRKHTLNGPGPNV